MKDRQFMAVLGLVVAAGLVMGLIAFRMTGGQASVAAAVGVRPMGGDPNAPRPSAADEVPDQYASAAPPSADMQAPNGEPPATTTDSPELGGPASNDPPGSAVDLSPPPAAPAGEPTQ